MKTCKHCKEVEISSKATFCSDRCRIAYGRQPEQPEPEQIANPNTQPEQICPQPEQNVRFGPNPNKPEQAYKHRLASYLKSLYPGTKKITLSDGQEFTRDYSTRDTLIDMYLDGNPLARLSFVYDVLKGSEEAQAFGSKVLETESETFSLAGRMA